MVYVCGFETGDLRDIGEERRWIMDLVNPEDEDRPGERMRVGQVPAGEWVLLREARSLSRNGVPSLRQIRLCPSWQSDELQKLCDAGSLTFEGYEGPGCRVVALPQD